MIPAAVTAGIGLLSQVGNNIYGHAREKEARYENYRYGEMQAQNADARTRALYKDFYSPEALLKQYKAAGLSPSLMFGGTPGQGGAAGAMGGTPGQPSTFMPISLVEAAQAAALFAQTEKTKAETANIQKETDIKGLQEEIQKIDLGKMKTDWEILNSKWVTEDGKATSLFEMARNSYSFEEFLKDVREIGSTGQIDPTIYEASQTEQGMKTLRAIYTAENRFHRDIMVLGSESVSADFQRQIIKAMQDKGFVELNADAAIKYLEQNIESAELTKTQKEAWNNLIDKLGQKGSTTRDIIVVLGMILNQMASNWKMPTINTGDHFVNINKTE